MRPRLWISIFPLLALISPLQAADEFAASFRLRGGYDSNPVLAPQGKGSPLIAWDAAAAYGHDSGEWIAGATAEASLVRYREEGFEPLENYRLRLRFANKGQHNVSFDATTTLARFTAYDTQNENANQRVHVQWTGGEWRPFVAGDLRHASLNELNVLLGDFLPAPHRYLRGTITPGLAHVRNETEFGILLGLSRTKYEDEFDLFGFRRDNDRVQPALYAKYSSNNLALAGAVSYLRAYSEDVDFSDVRAILFEASLSASWEKWSWELGIARTAEDTTFPVSPVTINTASQMKVMREINERTSAGIFARTLARSYWDSPFFSRLRVAGIEVQREIMEDVSLAAELGFARSLLISGVESDGVIATIALTKRIGHRTKK